MISMMMLLVVGGYLTFVVIVASWVYKKPKKPASKWLASIGSGILLVFAPVADDLAGKIYFNYLCATQGGIHVYQTVTLGQEYFRDDGTPIFYDRNKGLHEMSMADKYIGRTESEIVSNILNVEVRKKKIVDIRNNKTLGQMTYFQHFGGSLVNSTGLHASGTRCPPSNLEVDSIKEMSELVFVKNGI